MEKNDAHRPARARRLLSGALGVLGLIPLACGSSGPEMADVSGTVTYQGEPVPQGTISFQPVASGGTPAIGIIGPDGSYTLQTVEPSDGARLGRYRVAISTADVDSVEISNYAAPEAARDPLAIALAKYEDPETSGLTATVESGGNDIDFDLE